MTFCIAVRIGSVAPCRGRYSRYFAINLNHPEVGDLQTLRAVQCEGLVQPPKGSVPVQVTGTAGQVSTVSDRTPVANWCATLWVFLQWISPTACPLTSSPGELISLISLGVYSLPYVSDRQVLYTMVTRSYHVLLLTPFFNNDEKTKMYFLKDNSNMLSEKKVSKKSP